MTILPQISLISFLAGTIAVISAGLSLFFGWQLGHSVIDSMIYAVMLMVISVIEFAMPRLVVDAYLKGLRGYFFSALVVLLVTILISIAANFGWQSEQIAQYERQARVESEAYQSWRNRRDMLQAALDNAPVINAQSLESQKIQLQSDVEQMLAQTAYNSNNQSTGRSVAKMTSNCRNDSWYRVKYCSKINTLQAKLSQIDSQLVAAHTRQQLMQQLDEVNNAMPTGASVDFQLPAVVNISTAFGLDATVVKTHFLVVFAGVFELLGITLFLFNHYGRQTDDVIHPDAILEKVRALESANRFLLERLEYNRLSPTPPENALSTAIEKILANYQKGQKLTYSDLSKQLHRGNSFVKKVLDRMIENGLARRDENVRSIFLC